MEIDAYTHGAIVGWECFIPHSSSKLIKDAIPSLYITVSIFKIHLDQLLNPDHTSYTAITIADLSLSYCIPYLLLIPKYHGH